MQPITYVTFGLALFGFVAMLGGFIVAVWAIVRLFLRHKPLRLSANTMELRLLAASFIAACLGSSWLFLAPAYSGGNSCTTHQTIHPAESRREVSTGPNGETLETVTHSSSAKTVVLEDGNCEKRTRTFLEVNGPGVIPFFTVPIAFTLIPFAFFALRVRPLIEAIVAFLLGGQMAIGMSLYGAAFGPAGVLMLVASISAARTNAAQQNVAGVRLATK